MPRRFKTSWAVAAFLVIGMLVALFLLARDLGDSNDDEPEETGTVTRLAA
jgi:hypothetical protein